MTSQGNESYSSTCHNSYFLRAEYQVIICAHVIAVNLTMRPLNYGWKFEDGC